MTRLRYIARETVAVVLITAPMVAALYSWGAPVPGVNR